MKLKFDYRSTNFIFTVATTKYILFMTSKFLMFEEFKFLIELVSSRCNHNPILLLINTRYRTANLFIKFVFINLWLLLSIKSQSIN